MSSTRSTKRRYKAYPWRILDHHLNDQCVAFQTQDAAADWTLVNLAHHASPYYIEDAGGDLVELIYAGARWVGKESGGG